MAELPHFELQNVDNKSHDKHNSQENMGFDNHEGSEQVKCCYTSKCLPNREISILFELESKFNDREEGH